MLLVAIWIVFFMTTMTGTSTCTANYTEYFRNLAYKYEALAVIGRVCTVNRPCMLTNGRGSAPGRPRLAKVGSGSRRGSMGTSLAGRIGAACPPSRPSALCPAARRGCEAAF